MRSIATIILALSYHFGQAQSASEFIEKSRSQIRNNEDSAFFYIEKAFELAEDNLTKIEAIRWKGELIHYYERNPEKNVLHLNEAINLATSSEEWGILCEIYIDLGFYFRYTDNYPEAEKYYQRSLEIAIEKNLPASIAEANNSLGVANYYLGNHIAALNYYKKATEYYALAKDSLKVSKSLNNIAIIYKSQSNYKKAIEYYKESISIYENSPDINQGILRNRLYNLSRAYSANKQYDLAEETIRRIIHIDKNIKGEREGYIISLLIMVEHFIESKQFGRARDYELGIEYKLDSMDLMDMLPIVQLRRAWIFQDQNQFDSAYHYLKRHEAYFTETSDDQDKFEYFKNLSKTLVHLSPKDAIPYAKIALKISEQAGLKEWIQMIHETLYEAYKLTNNFSLALRHHELYLAYQDSLSDEEKSFEMGILQNEIDLVQSEARNTELESRSQIQNQQIRFQNTVIISIVCIVILLATIAILFRKQLNERKKLLQKIEAQAEKLKELDQAKTRFFANISHDLRSPLTLILGSLDKITERDYEVLDKESRELLDMGIKNGKRLLYLADEIMDLTRLEEGKVSLDLEYVKIVPYLRLLTKMFSSAADIKNIELRFSTHAEDETTLQIDPHQFEKIIYNLLSNAIKFTPEKGTVDVQLSTANSHVEISISDSGPGIPKESLELIFDRYYQSSTAKSSQAGVGIGLALVKELVELHGGTIEATSGEGGSIFTIQFPFKKSDWVSKAIIPERSLDVVTRNSLWIDLQEERERLQIPGIKNTDENAKAVLIVEDHKELRTYLQSILNTNFRIYLAANGANALELLQSEKIDLIITDLMMPYMDGFELVDHLKKDKELRKIPVMVVSARTDKKEKLDLISKGAEDVISKPFDKEELLAKIHNILGRDWDSNQTLTKLYGETVEEFERNVMHRLESLIIKRIDDPHLSVLDLADEMAASERKVYRMIKKISGLTPYELIKEVRWQYLENYLKNNKVKTATEAAQIIGMSNASSFSNQFEKRFGYPFREAIS